jgi:hypothetical protein
MKKIILSVFVLVAIVGMVQAAPFQTMGLLRTPDAYVIPHKSAHLTLVGYYRNVDEEEFIPYGMLGVGLFNRLQLDGFAGDDIYFMNAKVKLIPETLYIPQISVGMDNIFSTVNVQRAQDYNDPSEYSWADNPDKCDYEHFSPYVVASKQAVIGGLSWMFNLGGGANRFTGQTSRSRVFSGMFASLEVSPTNNLSFQGEFDGQDFNVGLKYSLGNYSFKVAAQAVENYAKNNGLENTHRIGFGVTYLFDKFAEGKTTRPVIFNTNQLSETEESHCNCQQTILSTDSVKLVELKPVIKTQSEIPVTSSMYKEFSPEYQTLLEEIRNLRGDQQQVQKEMEEIRSWLQELQKQSK